VDDSGDSDEKITNSCVEKLEDMVGPINGDKRLSNGSLKSSIRLSNKQVT
jgi:hypothetical protein